jgi:hypothetical protein
MVRQVVDASCAYTSNLVQAICLNIVHFVAALAIVYKLNIKYTWVYSLIKNIGVGMLKNNNGTHNKGSMYEPVQFSGLKTSAELHAEETLKKFNEGIYDPVAFDQSPELTDDLKIVIEKYNRAFIQRLFLKCDSNSCMHFWLEPGRAHLPDDALALAWSMHNNIFVVRYLKEKGWYDSLSKDEKNEFLARSAMFMNEESKYGEGSRYLKKEFSKQNNKPAI